MINTDNILFLKKAYRSIHQLSSLPLAKKENWRLAYAYENPEIAEKLGTDGLLDSIKTFLIRRDKVFAKELLAFEDSSSAATMNPHKELKDTSYYVTTETFEQLDIITSTIEEEITSPAMRVFIHIGAKGSGKTATQNQWLYHNHKKLETLKVFYIRCDAAKLFDHWSLTKPNDWSECPTVDEYHTLQLLYIIGKYHNHDNPDYRSTLIQEICEKLKSEQIQFDHLENRELNTPVTAPMLVMDYIENHVSIVIRRYEVANTDLSYVRDNMFMTRKTKRREWFRWISCSNAITKWMQENGYWQLRILDGVDNLHINTAKGKSCYNAFIPQLISFALRSPAINEIRLATMREKTYYDACTEDPITTASAACIMPCVIWQVAAPLNLILKHRAIWLETNFSSERKLSSMINEIRKFLEHVKLKIFNDNCRNAIVAIAALAATIRFRQIQSNITDIKSQVEIQWRRNLLLQYRLYLTTQKLWDVINREKGAHFFNPFWINESLLESRNCFFDKPILARIRLLEYLDCSGYNERSIDNIKNYLTHLEYSDGIINSVIEDATAYGWADTVFQNCNNALSITGLEITDSGKFLLTELLRDVDTLYVCALDTLVPEFLIENGAIRVHSNHIRGRTGYRGAALSTVITFISIISQLNKREISISKKHPRYSHITGKRFLTRNSKKIIWKQMLNILSNCEQEDIDDLKIWNSAAQTHWKKQLSLANN